jgi:hypothetical protein
MKQEAKIQVEIFDWIRKNEEEFEVLKCVYHTPNSFFGTGFGVINYLKKLGMRNGVYDIIVPIDNDVYSALYIEVKSKNGKLSDSQKQFKDIIMRHTSKWPLFVEVFDSNAGIELISKYLGLEDEDDER